MGEDDTKSTKTTKSKKNLDDAKTVAPAAEEEEPSSPPVQEEDGGFMQFLWNGDTKEFLGRNWKSWLDITIFYIIFFASLACFFVLQWYVSLLLINPDKPYVGGEGSMLYEKGPGLTFRPAPDRSTSMVSSLIWFSTANYDGYDFFSRQLRGWFKGLPTAGGGVKACSGSDTTTDKEVCEIKSDLYGDCDGTDKNFGYSRGEPCILLKLNRIYGWKPDPMDQNKIQAEQGGFIEYFNKNGYVKERVYIWCEGETDHDKENIGPIEYFPGPYLEAKYFPFKKQKNYQSPFIMLKLRRPLPGALLSFVCKAYAKNITPDKESGVGYLRFQVLM